MTQKAILFDLDGTLTDSGEGIINSAAMTLRHYGLPVPDYQQMRVFVGPPLHETFMKFGVPHDKADEAVDVYRTRYNTIGKFENSPYPGIPELLQHLQEQGHRLYIATSKPEGVSNEILAHFGLSRYFTLICGATEDRSRLEKAQVIQYLLEQVGPTEDIVMVGDTAFDVIGAKAHGIPAIGVSWGYGSVQDIVDAGAIAVAHTVDELRKLLEQ